MNGEDLPAPHGGPVRLLVPGWSGIASTKWLIGLTVLNHAFQGELNINQYVIIDEQGAPVRSVQAMPVSSAIWSPKAGETLKAGPVQITGYAWSGLGAITRVEVSTDDGGSWNDAQITERRGEHSWARFQYTWDAAPGPAVLLARATDVRGTSQPLRETWNQLGYQYNSVQHVPVNVTA
jgi:DMSO/TMAO reductase YedYZ molybdopterin-dependent catalytic subunit